MPHTPTFECSICKQKFFRKQLFYPSLNIESIEENNIKVQRSYKARLPICFKKECYSIWSDKIKKQYINDRK